LDFFFFSLVFFLQMADTNLLDGFLDTPVRPQNERLIPKEKTLELQNGIRKINQFCLESTETRNVLIVGRTRSGKSTAVGVLKDPCYEPKSMSIFSDTVDPKFQSFALDDRIKSTKFTVNTIDTPGLKEVKEMGKEERSDAVILNTINFCLKSEITKINCLLIFISFELGVTRDDLDSFQTFLEKFEHKDIRIGICITRSESKPDHWREEIKDQLSQHAYFSQVLKRPNVQILFTGCVDVMKAGMLTTIEDLRNLYQKVYAMRRELLQFIFESDKQAMLIDLPIAAGATQTVSLVFQEQFAILDYLENQQDLGTSDCQLKIADFGAGVEKLSAFDALLVTSELSVQFNAMRTRASKVAKRMNPAQKRIFAGRLILEE